MRTFAFNKKQNQSSSRKMRHGLSLIEVVVMTSLTSTMLVMATGWIHKTMKQASRFRMEHREQLAMAQLSQHFRQHVRLSKSADTSKPESVSLTDPAGNQFRYSLTDQEINFASRNAEGELQAVERFALPAFSKASFAQTDDSMVAIKLETSAGAQTEPSESNSFPARTSLIIKSTLARWLPTSNPTSSGAAAELGAEDNGVPK